MKLTIKILCTYICIFLLIIWEPTSATIGLVHINPKDREKNERQVRIVKKRKGIKAQKVKSPTPSWAIDVLIGNEEQIRKQENKKKETGSGSPTQLPWTIPCLLQLIGILWAYSWYILEWEWGESGFHCWGSRSLCICYFCFTWMYLECAHGFTCPPHWVVCPSGSTLVTTSCFLAGNRGLS